MSAHDTPTDEQAASSRHSATTVHPSVDPDRVAIGRAPAHSALRPRVVTIDGLTADALADHRYALGQLRDAPTIDRPRLVDDLQTRVDREQRRLVAAAKTGDHSPRAALSLSAADATRLAVANLLVVQRLDDQNAPVARTHGRCAKRVLAALAHDAPAAARELRATITATD